MTHLPRIPYTPSDASRPANKIAPLARGMKNSVPGLNKGRTSYIRNEDLAANYGPLGTRRQATKNFLAVATGQRSAVV